MFFICFRFSVIMAGNTGQIDLNSEAVLFDRQNGVVGVKSSVPNVISVGVSRAETLIGEPVGGGEVAVHDQKVFDVGGDRGVNSSVEVFNGCEKEGSLVYLFSIFVLIENKNI